MTTVDIIIVSIGLAIDACCVCTMNGLVYRPKIVKAFEIAFLFGLFQGVMPLIGYWTIGFFNEEILKYNHIIAFILLSLVGIKMLMDAIKSQCHDTQKECTRNLTIKVMLVQAVSTSIDALTVGVSLSSQPMSFMSNAVALISIITFVMCLGSIYIGKRIGTRLNCKAEVIGGIVLIIIGIRLLIEGL